MAKPGKFISHPIKYTKKHPWEVAIGAATLGIGGAGMAGVGPLAGALGGTAGAGALVAETGGPALLGADVATGASLGAGATGLGEAVSGTAASHLAGAGAGGLGVPAAMGEDFASQMAGNTISGSTASPSWWDQMMGKLPQAGGKGKDFARGALMSKGLGMAFGGSQQQGPPGGYMQPPQAQLPPIHDTVLYPQQGGGSGGLMGMAGIPPEVMRDPRKLQAWLQQQGGMA